MDPKSAIIGLVALFGADTYFTCDDGRCAGDQKPAELELTAGSLIFRKEQIGSEIQARYVAKTSYGPLRPVFGGSISSKGDVWVGAGLKWQRGFGEDQGLYVEFSTMPGLYFKGQGPDLGHEVEIRSALGLGYKLDNGNSFALTFDHRSNADIAATNPGLETLGLRYTIPLN